MKRTILATASLCFVFACGGNDSTKNQCVDGTCANVKDVLESAFVDLVTALSAPTDDVVTVSLRDHADVFLDVSTARGDRWAERMGRQLEYQKPIYLEIELATREVLDYDVPIESEVHSLVDNQRGVEIHLVRSAAIHFLSRSDPKFGQFLDTLENAKQSGTLLLVTTDYNNGNQIRDVRELLAR